MRNGLGMAILSTSQGLMSDRAGAPGAHRRRAPRPRLVRRARQCRESESCRSRCPSGVTVTIDGNTRDGEGPEGRAVAHAARGDAGRAWRTATLTVTRPSDETAPQGAARPDALARRQHGRGRDEGLPEAARDHRASATRPRCSPYGLQLALGFSHPIEYKRAGGHQAHRAARRRRSSSTARTRRVVGQVAAEIRTLRPPEPYKGKGIKYQGEQIRRKAGKAGGK